MGKWEMVRLGEVCQFINGDRGINYPSKKDFTEAGVPFINAGHLSNKSIDFSEMNYISIEKFMQLGSGKVRNGDILYCLRGSLGKQAIVEDVDVGAIASSLVIMRPLLEVTIKYLSYCLESSEIFRQQLQANTGSSQPNLSATNVKNYLIPLPPLDEQKRIAKNLDLASEIVKGYKEQLAELDKLVQSVFYEMFGDPVTNEKWWASGTIRDVVREVKYGTSRPATVGGKYTYLRMNNITSNGHLDISNLKQIDIPDNELEKYMVMYGDVLFNRTNSKELVGKTCVYNLHTPMIIAGYIIRVRVNEKMIPEVLSAILNSRYGKNTLYGMCKAIIGQANINAQELQKIKIFIPPIHLQTRFAAIVTDIEAQKAQVQQALTEAENLFNSLMQEYFE